MGGNSVNFFMDGEARGQIKCGISNWTGILYKSPRTDLKNYKKSVYKEFKSSGYLEEHLKNIDQDADRMEDFLVMRMAELDGVTEELKQAYQMG
ncbi:MAG: TnpV protein [Eubacteriales bacterium]